MVTLEVNNSGEVGRPGVQPANMILLWGLHGSVGVRATATDVREEERVETSRRKRENGIDTRYLAPTVRAVNSTPAD